MFTCDRVAWASLVALFQRGWNNCKYPFMKGKHIFKVFLGNFD
jgi:hypothetical protein